MAEVDDVADWLIANQDKRGTPEYVMKAERFRQLDAGEPQQAGSPIDYNAPDEQVRSIIQGLPDERLRGRAYDQWARRYVQRENEQGGLAGVGQGISNAARSIARGTPVGPWLDELTALTNEKFGGIPYAETLAYQRARDADLAERHPGLNTLGNLTGAIGTAPLAYLRAGGPAATVAANLGINTGLGAVAGAGEATEGNRGTGAAWGAGTAAAISGMFAPGAFLAERYARSAITPEVRAAAQRLGINLPFYAEASDPRVMGLGRQAAQERPGGMVDQSWQGLRQGFDDAGNRVVQGATGAPRETAPAAAGQAVSGGMERGVNAMTGEIGRIGQDIQAVAGGPGAPVDAARLRQVATDLIGERAAAGHVRPEAGLDQTMNIATNPNATWQGVSRYTTELGQDIGRPDIVPRPVPQVDQQRLYAAVQGTDRPAAIEQAAGPFGRAFFDTGTARQAELAQLRDNIANAMRNRQPEQIVNMAHDASTLSGGGTRLNQIGEMTGQLTGGERTQLGGGVLAKVLNDAQRSGVSVPGGVAERLSRIPEPARSMLFQQGTPLRGQTDALQTLAERLGMIDRMQHVGSAKTIGSQMARNLGVPATGAAVGETIGRAVGLPPGVGGVAGGTLTSSLQALYNNVIQPYLLMQGLPAGAAGMVSRASSGIPTAAPQLTEGLVPKDIRRSVGMPY